METAVNTNKVNEQEIHALVLKHVGHEAKFEELAKNQETATAKVNSLGDTIQSEVHKAQEALSQVLADKIAKVKTALRPEFEKVSADIDSVNSRLELVNKNLESVKNQESALVRDFQDYKSVLDAAKKREEFINSIDLIEPPKTSHEFDVLRTLKSKLSSFPAV